MNYKIEGFEAVYKEIQKLPDDRMKRQKILAILRRQVKPILAAIKLAAPKADKVITIRKIDYHPENLKKSMAIKTSPMKHYPNVLVGPRLGGDQKYDGFYAFFIQYGTVKMKPNDFIARAAEPLMGTVTNSASNELEKYIYNESKKLNL